MAEMKISQLYVYPIKSLQPTALHECKATRHGFSYDRRFMLLKVLPSHLDNMQVSTFPEMSLFLTDLVFPTNENPNHDDEERNASGEGSGNIIVTYRPPGIKPEQGGGGDTGQVDKVLEVPLFPNTDGLKILDITLYSSSTKAYDMGSNFNDWFSACFGYEVILAYLGDNKRPVLGNLPLVAPAKKSQASSWLSAFTQIIPSYTSTSGDKPTSSAESSITFADVAPYLIVSETSLQDVSSRLPANEAMDITKFRPNIVVSGAATAFEEDFWAELRMITTNPDHEDAVKFHLTANCIRCVSINVDYATGKPGTGDSGSVLKTLMKDRRVDKGKKYRPVFGRYGFLDRGSRPGADGNGAGVRLRVGDIVEVVRRNEERTTFGESAKEN